MSSKSNKLPSPAMGVAFVALLAALTGTAVALPGNNSVTSGDIRNGQVKTQDIRNNNIRGKDIRNGTVTGRDIRDNSVTGADVNEGSLGTVPNASSAGVANRSTTANAAVLAGTAFNLASLSNSGLVGANDDQVVPLFTRAGFKLSLRCDVDAVDTLSGDRAEIVIENVSAGDDALFESDANNNSNFDVGEEDYLEGDNGVPDVDVSQYVAVSPATGAALSGSAAAGHDTLPGAYPTECVGVATGLG